MICLASCSNTPNSENIQATIDSAVKTAVAPYEAQIGDFVTSSDLEASQNEQNREIQQYIADQIDRAKDDLTNKDVEITRSDQDVQSDPITYENGTQITATPEYADFDNTNCVDEFTYVSDITVPDGMTITPHTIFTKTWYVRNSGTCMWNSNYKIVYHSGDDVGRAKSFPLLRPGNYIRPGESTVVTVELLAPSEIGSSYSTSWALESDNGIRFGSGPAKNVYLSSNFRVDSSFILSQNFGSIICSDDFGYFTCGINNSNSDRGSVYYDETPMTEAGRYLGSPGIAVIPPKGENTTVRFEFGPLRFPRGSWFYTNFSCRPETPTCDVQVRLYARETGYGERLVQEIREWNDGFMGEWEFKLDDIEVFDQDFTYIIEVQANGGVESDDLILFTNTKIY